MDAQPQSLLLSAAQCAVERAAIPLLLPDAPQPVPPSWLRDALEKIAVLAAALWLERQAAPSRAELRALLARPHLDLKALRRRLSDTPIIATTLLRRLQEEGTETLRAKLSGGGQSDAFDKLDCPSAKLMIAYGVIALHQEIRGSLPNPKNTRLLALCAALLWRARERAEDLASAPDARSTQWGGALHEARRLYAAGKASAAGEDSAGELVRYAVNVALRRQADKG